MRSFFERLKYKYSLWMQGRYGQDILSLHLFIIGVIFYLIGCFLPPVSILGLLCFLFSVFRIYSKNIYKRERELYKYQQIKYKINKMLDIGKKRWRDRKTHRYYKCKCGTMLRVPKGKGKINISCPKCGEHLIRKT